MPVFFWNLQSCNRVPSIYLISSILFIYETFTKKLPQILWLYNFNVIFKVLTSFGEKYFNTLTQTLTYILHTHIRHIVLMFVQMVRIRCDFVHDFIKQNDTKCARVRVWWRKMIYRQVKCEVNNSQTHSHTQNGKMAFAIIETCLCPNIHILCFFFSFDISAQYSSFVSFCCCCWKLSTLAIYILSYTFLFDKLD